MRKTLSASLAALTAASTLASAAPASPPNLSAPGEFPSALVLRSGFQLAQYGPNRDAYRDRGYWDRRQGRGYYDRTYGRERHDNGSAVAAGFLGFVLGAAIAGSATDRDQAAARLNDPAWTASCASRYRSFDAHSGTYLGNDGLRHYCQ